MTLREAAKGKIVSDSGPMDYNIGFNGSDETQFTARNLTELECLWRGFCEENKFKKSSVDYVERV